MDRRCPRPGRRPWSACSAGCGWVVVQSATPAVAAGAGGGDVAEGLAVRVVVDRDGVGQGRGRHPAAGSARSRSGWCREGSTGADGADRGVVEDVGQVVGDDRAGEHAVGVVVHGQRVADRVTRLDGAARGRVGDLGQRVVRRGVGGRALAARVRRRTGVAAAPVARLPIVTPYASAFTRTVYVTVSVAAEARDVPGQRGAGDRRGAGARGRTCRPGSRCSARRTGRP